MTPTWKAVLSLAWPVLLQQWLVLAVTLSDRLLAGRFQDGLSAGDQAATQAAQTTAQYLGWFLASTAVLVNAGSAAAVAHRVGAGDRRGADDVLHQSLLLALAVGVAWAVLFSVLLVPFLVLLQLQGDTIAFAAAYLRPLLPALPLHLVGAAGVACLHGAGDTKAGMWVYGAEAALNVPLAWAGFHLFGFVGIAAGTAVAQALGGVAVLAVLLRGRAGLRLKWRKLAVHRPVMRDVLEVSVPAAADSLSMQAGYLIFLAQVNTLGEEAAAAHGIALMWEALGYLTGVGFGTAALTLVGQARGAGRPEQADRAAWTAFGMGAAAMSLMGVVFFVLAGPMFRLMCPHETQAGIVAQGVPVLRLVAFGMPALAACMVFVQALRGAGDARAPLLFTWLGFFGVRIPLTFLLLRGGWGLFGAWLAMSADLYVRGACLLIRWRLRPATPSARSPGPGR
ncbi:MAG: MATE family efflux transporter [Gemmataceae bacterium]